ncbi:hypothetical protein GCM10027098_19360 [Bowmanella dokdonensis]
MNKVTYLAIMLDYRTCVYNTTYPERGKRIYRYIGAYKSTFTNLGVATDLGRGMNESGKFAFSFCKSLYPPATKMVVTNSDKKPGLTSSILTIGVRPANHRPWIVLQMCLLLIEKVDLAELCHQFCALGDHFSMAASPYNDKLHANYPPSLKISL